MAFDAQGNEVVSGDPGSATGWPASTQGGGANDDIGPTVCASDRLCISACTVGSGFSGAECPGSAYDAGDVIVSDSGTETIAPDPIVQLWCHSVSLCFAADQFSNLYVTTDPSNVQAGWPVVYSALPPGSSRYDVIDGVACPAVTLCVAFDSSGNLIDGLPPATAAKMNAALTDALTATRNKSVIRRVASGQGYREMFRATAPGRLLISWYRHGTKVRIAGGVVTFGRPGAKVIKISPTKRAAHSLAATLRASLTEVATFDPLIGKTMTARRTLRL
jgi:hypothetical protein